jgi:hypothetical protein
MPSTEWVQARFVLVSQTTECTSHLVKTWWRDRIRAINSSPCVTTRTVEVNELIFQRISNVLALRGPEVSDHVNPDLDNVVSSSIDDDLEE